MEAATVFAFLCPQREGTGMGGSGGRAEVPGSMGESCVEPTSRGLMIVRWGTQQLQGTLRRGSRVTKHPGPTLLPPSSCLLQELPIYQTQAEAKFVVYTVEPQGSHQGGKKTWRGQGMRSAGEWLSMMSSSLYESGYFQNFTFPVGKCQLPNVKYRSQVEPSGENTSMRDMFKAYIRNWPEMETARKECGLAPLL